MGSDPMNRSHGTKDPRQTAASKTTQDQCIPDACSRQPWCKNMAKHLLRDASAEVENAVFNVGRSGEMVSDRVYSS